MKSWFEDQIEERREADRQALEESFQDIAQVVLGQHIADKLGDELFVTKQAIDLVLKYYHLKPVELPDSILNGEEQIDYCLRHYGIMKRSIELKDLWYEDAYGPILGFFKDGGSPVALLPNSYQGYFYIDPASNTKVRLNKKTAQLFEREAICFYRPLPPKKLGISDLILYIKSNVTMWDLAAVLIATLLTSLVGLLLPKITVALTGPVLYGGNPSALIGTTIFILSITISTQLITSMSGLLTERIKTKVTIGIESSMMMRILSLPVSFHRNYSPGELKSRSLAVNELCSLLEEIFLGSGLTALASLLYITQIFRYATPLVLPSVVIIIATVAVSVAVTLMHTIISKKIREHSAKESGLTYSIITGIQKIKLAGAEKRIFAKWLKLYAEGAELEYNPPTFLKINNVITTAITLFSTIIIYSIAVEQNISQSAYFGFTAAYGFVMGAFTNLSSIALSLAQIKPILDMAAPFLKTVPENADNKEILTDISGNVEIAHVSFKYDQDLPYILEDFSLKIKAGDYVAIVGQTGCGKSTLIRLLLGFETPEKGAIYYDGKDISHIDLSSLRKKIGTVTQDGGLFQGDIYSNIVITKPSLVVEEAMEAARIAGLAEDIENMPMGIHTVISEGQGGISGGQKQRIMIARAIAPNPKLLIFDEATSALDNVTQKKVSEALDKMGCTRIVVAHRLSTIKHCDRIVVIDGGHIIEDGTYEELIEKDGYFAELVARQRLDA